MKNIIIFLFLALTITSCSDFLSLDPPTQISEDEYFKNEDEMLKALSTAYGAQGGGYNNYGLGFYNLVSDVLSQDLLPGGGDGSDGPQIQCLTNYSMNYVYQPFWLWVVAYQGVYAANVVIDKAPQATGNKENIDRMVAEAHLLRNLSYYWLWLHYGRIMTMEHNLNSQDEYYNQKQKTADEVYEFLINDLDNNAIDKLPEQSQIPLSEQGRVSNGLAKVLRAKIVLYQKDNAQYAKTYTQLKEIINSGEYTLMPNFDAIWQESGEWCSESIFEINFSADLGGYFPQVYGARDLNAGTSGFLSGWGFGTVQQAAVSLYGQGDIRKNATVLSIPDSVAKYKDAPVDQRWVYNGQTTHQYTGYFLKKVAPRAKEIANQSLKHKNNARVFRYSDVLLMAAELSLNGVGSTSDGQNYFAQVYKRARPQATTVPTLTLEKLQLERRLEFLGEGQRYWDIMRWGLGETLLSPYGWKAFNKYLPIPDGDIINSQGSLTQNPGYTK